MKTQTFIRVISGNNSSIKISDLDNSQELYFRLYFFGSRDLAEEYRESFFGKPDPINLVSFLVSNLKTIITNSKLTSYTPVEQKQLLASNPEQLTAVLLNKFTPEWKDELSIQDWFDQIKLNDQIRERVPSNSDDNSQNIKLFGNGLPLETCPPAIYDCIYWYMGEQIDKCGKKYANDEVGYVQFITRVIKLMFKPVIIDEKKIQQICDYLIRDLELNYPSKGIPGKVMLDATQKDIKANTLKVDDKFLDTELQQVIQQQKIRQQQDAGNVDVAKLEISNRVEPRKNGTMVKMVYIGAYAVGELYPVDKNQGKRCAGKYMSLPFKATRNTLAQYPSTKIVKVKDGKVTKYRYVTGDLSDFSDFCGSAFHIIKQPRVMWEVK